MFFFRGKPPGKGASFSFIYLFAYLGFPGGSVVKNPLAMQETLETWVHSLGSEDPIEKGMAPLEREMANLCETNHHILFLSRRVKRP